MRRRSAATELISLTWWRWRWFPNIVWFLCYVLFHCVCGKVRQEKGCCFTLSRCISFSQVWFEGSWVKWELNIMMIHFCIETFIQCIALLMIVNIYSNLCNSYFYRVYCASSRRLCMTSVSISFLRRRRYAIILYSLFFNDLFDCQTIKKTVIAGRIYCIYIKYIQYLSFSLIFRDFKCFSRVHR